MSFKKIILLLFTLLLGKTESTRGQTMTSTASTYPKKYFVFVKYKIEVSMLQDGFREREIKVEGENKSGAELGKFWTKHQTIFSTEAVIKGTNFEANKDPETGIISMSSTPKTKILSRKGDGKVGKSSGSITDMDIDKWLHYEWITTKFDIAHNEGHSRPFECSGHTTLLGEGSTDIELPENDSYAIQFRYNPKNKRAEIRNWLVDFDLNFDALQSIGKAGDKICSSHFSTTQTIPGGQMALGLGQMLKNGVIYNNKETPDDSPREIPYKDISSYGEFLAFRFSNQILGNEVTTENRYVFSTTFKDSYQEITTNLPNNPNGYYHKEFAGKIFMIRGSITIAFQQKEPSFDEYPGGELPEWETPAYDMPWVPLMDRDDYPAPPKDKARIITIIAQHTDGAGNYVPRINTPIEAVSKVNGVEKRLPLQADQTGKIVFDANQLLADKRNKETISFYPPFLVMPAVIANIPLFGEDTTIYFSQKARNITLRMQDKATKRGIAGQPFLMYNEEIRDSLTLFKSGADGNVLISSHWTYNISRPQGKNVVQISVDSTFVPSIVHDIPTFGGDTTIVFEKISSINQSNIIGYFKSTIDTETQALPIINVKIEQTGNNNIVQTFPRRVEAVVAQEFNHQTTQVGEMSIVPQPPANLKVYPSYQTINIPRGENQIVLPVFLVLPRNTPVYQITGTIKNRWGVPVSGTEVALNTNIIAITDAQGKYTVYVPAGTYSISASDTEEGSVSVTVVNQSSTVNFKLK